MPRPVLRRSAARRGLTLLEVLVVALLLSVGLVGALSVIHSSISTTQRLRDRTRGLTFARSKMEELLKLPVLELGSEEGRGVDQTTEFDWAVRVEESDVPGLYRIIVQAQNRNGGDPILLTALRRPDLVNPPEGSPEAATGASSGTAGPGAGGTLQ